MGFWQTSFPPHSAPRSRRLALSALLGACFVCCANACATDGAQDGSPGELGVGKFRYICVKSGDFMCSDTFAAEDFDYAERAVPEAVAVGSEFSLDFLGKAGRGAPGLTARVEAVGYRDERAGDRFSVSRPADASFIAIRSSGKVVDYLNIRAEEARSLHIEQDFKAIESLSLAVGEKARLSVRPLSASGETLGGALNYKWGTDSAEVVSLNKETERWTNEHGDGGDVIVVAEQPGTTHLSVTSASLSAQLQVHVE